MAFVLQLSPTYEWPMSIEVPVDGGKFRKFSFTVIFNRLPQSRIDEIMLAQQELKAAADRNVVGKEFKALFHEVRAHAAEVLAGWKGVKSSEAGDEDMPATVANMALFLDVPGMANAVIQTYSESLVEAKRGN